MFFTWYFISIVLVSAILGLLLPIGWYLFYGLTVLCLFWLLDLFLTIKQPRIEVLRKFDIPIYQHQKAIVELIFQNPTHQHLKIHLKDEPPFVVKANRYQGRIIIPPYDTAHFAYEIISPKRGAFFFGDLNLRLTGRFQLFSRQIKIPLTQELRVYPDLMKILAYRLARLTGSQTEGLLRQKMYGAGGEMAQLREYVPGDDYRKINWKVTARRGKPFVNEFEPEKDQNIFLLFDTGRLLFDQAVDSNSRFDHILDSAILLSYNIHEHGDMLGALSFNHKVERFLPVGKGNHHLKLLISQFFDLQAMMVESDYRGAFNFLQSKINKRCLIFIYTDLLDGESSKDLINHMKVLSRHHLVVCVLTRQTNLDQLLDQPIKDEKNAYLHGTILEFLQERTNLIHSLQGSGVKVLEVNAGTIRSNVVEHYLYLKEKGLF